MIEYINHRFLASDESPWHARIKGCKVVGRGNSKEEALEDFVQTVNILDDLSRNMKKLVRQE